MTTEMKVTPAVERAAEALWDRRRDHSEDPAWGSPELHARFEQSYRDDARAALSDALVVDEMARVLHCDDAANGNSSWEWDDLNDTTRAWYRRNAAALRGALLGENVLRTVASAVPASSGRRSVAVPSASQEPADTNHGTEKDLEHDGFNSRLDGNSDKGIEREEFVHTAWLEICRPVQDPDTEKCRAAVTPGSMSTLSNTGSAS